jgi:hypothetical protein
VQQQNADLQEVYMGAAGPACHDIGNGSLRLKPTSIRRLITRGKRGGRPKARPFYRRWWFRAPAVLAVLLIFGAATNFGAPSTTTSSTIHPVAAPGGNTLSQAVQASTPTLPTDQGWVLEGYRFDDHALGDFGAKARVTNTNNTAQSAVITITVLVKGHPVATLQGFVGKAATGKVFTVQLTSRDKYEPGPYTIDFQTGVTQY